MAVARYQQLRSATLKLFNNMACVKGTHIASSDWNKIGIDCFTLDLQATPPEGVFVTPFPKGQLHSVLDSSPALAHLATSLRGDPYGNLTDALNLSKKMSSSLNLSPDNRQPDLLSMAALYERGMNIDNCEHLYMRRGLHQWQVESIFEKQDGSTPHISLLLSDETPLDDNRLSLAEMACIFVLTASRIRMKRYRVHRVIPVTIISLASLNGRVVHGYIDVETTRLKVFKSPILELATDDDDKSSIETLLSWCIGNAVGSTMWEPNCQVPQSALGAVKVMEANEGKSW